MEPDSLRRMKPISVRRNVFLPPSKELISSGTKVLFKLMYLYFFNIPTHAHNIHTLKSTKIYIKNT
jgi:hypothetical protein